MTENAPRGYQYNDEGSYYDDDDIGKTYASINKIIVKKGDKLVIEEVDNEVYESKKVVYDLYTDEDHLMEVFKKLKEFIDETYSPLLDVDTISPEYKLVRRFILEHSRQRGRE
jgi:hypothetical protein